MNQIETKNEIQANKCEASSSSEEKTTLGATFAAIPAFQAVSAFALENAGLDACRELAALLTSPPPPSDAPENKERFLAAFGAAAAAMPKTGDSALTIDPADGLPRMRADMSVEERVAFAQDAASRFVTAVSGNNSTETKDQPQATEQDDGNDGSETISCGAKGDDAKCENNEGADDAKCEKEEGAATQRCDAEDKTAVTKDGDAKNDTNDNAACQDAKEDLGQDEAPTKRANSCDAAAANPQQKKARVCEDDE